MSKTTLLSGVRNLLSVHCRDGTARISHKLQAFDGAEGKNLLHFSPAQAPSVRGVVRNPGTATLQYQVLRYVEPLYLPPIAIHLLAFTQLEAKYTFLEKAEKALK